MKITAIVATLFFLLMNNTLISEAQTMNPEPLTAKQQAIVTISAFTATGEIDKLKTALNEGLDAGLSVNEIKEVLVQMYAYAGFPRSLNALGTFMGVVDERQSKGIKDEMGKEPSPLPTDRGSLAFGTENQTKLIGEPVAGRLFEFAPAIDQFLKAHLFGDIFQRDNLDWQTRELATIAALASMEGVTPQLQAHYAIGMHNGLTVEQLKDMVSVLQAKVGKAAGDNADSVLNKILVK